MPERLILGHEGEGINPLNGQYHCYSEFIAAHTALVTRVTSWGIASGETKRTIHRMSDLALLFSDDAGTSVVHHTHASLDLPTPVPVISGDTYALGMNHNTSNVVTYSAGAGAQQLRYDAQTYTGWVGPDPLVPFDYTYLVNAPINMAAYGWIAPTLSKVDRGKLYVGNVAKLTCLDAMDVQGTGKLELCDNADYNLGNKYALIIDAWSDNAVSFHNDASLPVGDYYLFLTTDLGLRNATGLSISVSNSRMDLLAGLYDGVYSGNVGANTWEMTAYVASDSGTVHSIWTYGIASGNVKATLYDGSGNLLAASLGIAAVGGVWTEHEIGDVDVVQGQVYYIGVIADTTGAIAWYANPSYSVDYKFLPYGSFVAPDPRGTGFNVLGGYQAVVWIGGISSSDIPIITDIVPSSVGNSDRLSITGSNLMGSGATVEVADGSDYYASNRYILYIISEEQNEIIARMDNEGGFYGPGYIFVTNGYFLSEPYAITVLPPSPPTVFTGDYAGYGHQPFGRHCFGGMRTDVEPRFSDSNPVDGDTGVSVLFVSAKTSIYCFSSRIQNVHVEISEDGGGYVDAYVGGSFVAPYDGSDSYVDFQQADPQKMTIQIEKTIPWDENVEVMIRVTATDQFGNEATKELPITW